MRITKSMSLVAVCTALLPIAAARAEDPTPDQRAQLGDFAYAKGKWTCTGKAYDVTSSSFKDTHSSYTVASKLDGTWLQGYVDEDEQEPNPYEGLYLVSFDSQWKKYVRYAATNKGGWGWATSTGFSGDSITWDGKFQNFEGRSDVTSKLVETRDGDDAFDLTLTYEGTDSNWHTLYEGHCARQKPAGT